MSTTFASGLAGRDANVILLGMCRSSSSAQNLETIVGGLLAFWDPVKCALVLDTDVVSEIFSNLRYAPENVEITGLSSFSQLDVKVFLHLCVYCAHVRSERVKEKPGMFSSSATAEQLTSDRQRIWWRAAWSLCRGVGNIEDCANLQQGLETIRLKSQDVTELPLLVSVAAILENEVPEACRYKGNNPKAVAASDYAKLYWNTINNIWERDCVDPPNVDSFFYAGLSPLPRSRRDHYRSLAKYYRALNALMHGKADECVSILEGMQTPLAYFALAQVYKQNAQDVGGRLSDGDAQIRRRAMLLEARDSLRLAMNKFEDHATAGAINEVEIMRQLDEIEESLAASNLALVSTNGETPRQHQQGDTSGFAITILEKMRTLTTTCDSMAAQMKELMLINKTLVEQMKEMRRENAEHRALISALDSFRGRSNMANGSNVQYAPGPQQLPPSSTVHTEPASTMAKPQTEPILPTVNPEMESTFPTAKPQMEQTSSSTNPQATPMEPTLPPSNKPQLSTLDMFKPKPGSWACDGCYTRNDATADNCMACGTTGPAAASEQQQPKSSVAARVTTRTRVRLFRGLRIRTRTSTSTSFIRWLAPSAQSATSTSSAAVITTKMAPISMGAASSSVGIKLPAFGISTAVNSSLSSAQGTPISSTPNTTTTAAVTRPIFGMSNPTSMPSFASLAKEPVASSFQPFLGFKGFGDIPDSQRENADYRGLISALYPVGGRSNVDVANESNVQYGPCPQQLPPSSITHTEPAFSMAKPETEPTLPTVKPRTEPTVPVAKPSMEPTFPTAKPQMEPKFPIAKSQGPPMEPSLPPSSKPQLSTLVTFKPKPGSWACDGCYMRNDATASHCIACGTPGPAAASQQHQSKSTTAPAVTTSKAALIASTATSFSSLPPSSQSATSTPSAAVTATKTAPISTSAITDTNFSDCSASSIAVNTSFPSAQGTPACSTQSTTATASVTRPICFKSNPASTPSFASLAKEPVSPAFQSFKGFFKGCGNISGSQFQVFGKVVTPTPRQGTVHDDSGSAYRFEPTSRFKPVVPLPPLVEMKSGEEEEEVLFRERAILYRWDQESKAFKERGVGDLKILKHPETGAIRVLMRREQILKLCANHRIMPGMKLSAMQKSDRAFTWNCQDYADGELKSETLAAKFKDITAAQKFKEIFESAANKN